MPAPRLLDKRTINASLATERKQEIDKGKVLADSIQALRETKAKEEGELEEFRLHTVKVIQAQIANQEKQANDRLQVLLREEEALKARIMSLQLVEDSLRENIISKL